MKTSILIISDPKGGEEALARVFNGLGVAVECKNAGDEIELGFIGTGTRWPAELSKISHPANGLYNEVRDVVAGASRACAMVFGAEDGVKAAGVAEKTDNAIPGTAGMLSLRRYLAEGWQVLIF